MWQVKEKNVTFDSEIKNTIKTFNHNKLQKVSKSRIYIYMYSDFLLTPFCVSIFVVQKSSVKRAGVKFSKD